MMPQEGDVEDFQAVDNVPFLTHRCYLKNLLILYKIFNNQRLKITYFLIY